jgi:hypothetical protein
MSPQQLGMDAYTHMNMTGLDSGPLGTPVMQPLLKGDAHVIRHAAFSDGADTSTWIPEATMGADFAHGEMLMC